MRVYKRGDTPVELIQIYGERNSGTTYLCALLQDNLKDPANLLGLLPSEKTPKGFRTFGYKHWFVDPDKLADPGQAATLFVVIYRNPYTWLKAMMDRPYALEQSLTGKSVKDLPTIKLVGRNKGRETSNEFDPATGKRLTIFELRQKKIESFDAVAAMVDNAAYINLEELLDDPPAVMRRLAAEFPTAFADTLSLDRPPYRQLLREHKTPHQFSAAEKRVLDDHINWARETSAGYARTSDTHASAHRVPVLILHGASSVGKTHLMQSAMDDLIGFEGIEMDDCKFWADRPSKYDATAPMSPDQPMDRDLNDLMAINGSLGQKSKLCVEFLIDQLMDCRLGAPDTPETPRAIVVTGGALPGPAAPGDPCIYKWIADRLPVAFHHLLVEIPADLHDQRIAKRGRSHLRKNIYRDTARKSDQRDRFDAVIADWDALLAYLGAVSVDVTPKPAHPARAPNLRIHRAGPQLIQIYGERNSGTKYLKQLVTDCARYPDKILGAYANKKDPVNKARLIGYKHYYPRLDRIQKHQHNALFLVIYKNPYTWIRSMMAKPYHFKACFDGKGIVDLPDVALAGTDVHGRAIPDVHPDTGENISLFELRKHKILKWEELRNHVNNVVYVNYEDLLLRPTEITQRIADSFTSLFDADAVPTTVPDRRYVRKYVEPDPFTEAELSVINEHIDWSVEAQAGYEMGNLFVPAGASEKG